MQWKRGGFECTFDHGVTGFVRSIIRLLSAGILFVAVIGGLVEIVSHDIIGIAYASFWSLVGGYGLHKTGTRSRRRSRHDLYIRISKAPIDELKGSK